MKKFKLFALAIMAMLSTNAMADPVVIAAANYHVSEAAGVYTYAPVVSGKSPLVYTITEIKATAADGKTFSSGTVSVAMNGEQMAGYTSIEIPAKVSIPVKCTLAGGFDGTYEFDVTTVANNGFLNLKTLTSVTLPASITGIGDNAFQGTALGAITFPDGLKTIGASAFTKGTGTNTTFPEFSELSIPASVTTIGASAFEACENLTTVTLAASSWLKTIGAGAFAYTSIVKLDLSNATANNNDTPAVLTDDGLQAIGGIFTSVTNPTNGIIKEVVLPATCATINANAFENCVNLTTIDLTKVKTINGSAFKGDVKLASVKIGTALEFAAAAGISVGANAFTGCKALQTVELGKLIAASIDNAAFAGEDNGDGAGGGADGDFNDPEDFLPAGIKYLKYNEIAAAQTTTPFIAILTIEEVHFQKYISVNAAIPTTSFNVNAAGAKLTKIYYNAETVELPEAAADFYQPFHAAAFGASALDADRKATLTTLLGQYTAVNGFNTNAKVLNGVTIDGGYTTDVVIGFGTDTKKLAKDKNSDNYYYFFKPAGLMKIAKANEGGAKVTVYQAYIDVFNKEVSCMFQPLALVEGQYVVEAGKTVIIKSNKENGVKAQAAGTAASTMLYVGGVLKNDLNVTDAKVSLLKVQTDANYLDNGNKELWFFNNPTASGFGFTKFDTENQTSGLGANTVYMTCANTAAARMNIVWLDEDGQVTAIQKVEKAAADNGAIYNLRGEKVNAAYKGLVIKNGKKYIQK